ncbi:MAG: thioredoxin TrxC [Desulfobacterales bacterium]|nr:thioredoxin TrxC [Desulfobacterales bacterium]
MPDSVILACEACRAKNRVPRTRLSETPVCGRCKARLPVGNLSRVTSVTDANFNTVVMEAALPVMVDCWAPWCGPCRAVAPVLDDLARDYAGRVRIVKLNLDENPATGSRFGITSVPTIMLVKNGRIIETLVGAQPREIMEAALGRLI